jgi:integrase
MAGRQAKTLSAADVNDLLVFAGCTRNPLRNRVIVLLSAKAGLRANEIANLTWDMVLSPTGQVSGIIELRDHAAKKRSGRSSLSIRNSVPPSQICAPLRLTPNMWSPLSVRAR